MDLQPDSTISIERSDRQSSAETRLQGVWLVLARAVCLIVVLGSLLFFGISLPSYFNQMQSLCTGMGCIGLAPEDIRGLHALGVPLAFYASCLVGFVVFYILIWTAIAGILFWRKSADRMALFTGLMLVTFAIIQTKALETLPSGLAWFDHIIRILASICFMLFFYLFPGGQFVPRWTRWLSIAEIVFWVGNEYINYPPYSILFWLDLAIFVVILVSLPVAQVYRYRRVSGPLQRQQTKWVVFGLALTIGVYLGIIVLAIFFPVIEHGVVGKIFADIVFPFVLLPIPISIGFAIVRSHLWDIDIIIRRTLIYGTLTALLAALYFGLIFALQALFEGFFHQNNAVAIVVSTLAIAALSQPLRHRIQRIIDHRFYRRKYDATRTVEAFSSTLRNEVDLSQLSEHLVAVVQESMQPEHVSLWLRKERSQSRSERE